MEKLSSRVGRYITCSVAEEPYQAYIPAPLPPDPPLELEQFFDLLTQASQCLGKLDGVTDILPDTNLMLYFYVRKEAVLSSQIEGTQSSLSDLLLSECGEKAKVPWDDVQEVSSYVAAMEYGLQRLKEGFPLSLRLIREIHGVLLSNGRGKHSQPGEFRRSQNWIGGSRPGNAAFVPPPPDQLMPCLDNLEKFLHSRDSLYPTLIKAALAHVQFETIHPFLDGNGRLGRLLITFLLCAEGTLKSAVLYLSLYFKQNRQAYYDQLTRVRHTGDWESWLKFFLTGVIETTKQVIDTSQRIEAVFSKDGERIQSLKRAAISAQQVYGLLKARGVTTVAEAMEALQVSAPTARAALKNLVALKIVEEHPGKDRSKLYVYRALLDILEEGGEPF